MCLVNFNLRGIGKDVRFWSVFLEKNIFHLQETCQNKYFYRIYGVVTLFY